MNSVNFQVLMDTVCHLLYSQRSGLAEALVHIVQESLSQAQLVIVDQRFRNYGFKFRAN